MKREVIEVMTPGTLTDERLLQGRAANYLLAVHLDRRRSKSIGLAWFEASSGRFLVATVPADRLETELTRIGPAEIVIGDGSSCAAPATRRRTPRRPRWSGVLEPARAGRGLPRLGPAPRGRARGARDAVRRQDARGMGLVDEALRLGRARRASLRVRDEAGLRGAPRQVRARDRAVRSGRAPGPRSGHDALPRDRAPAWTAPQPVARRDAPGRDRPDPDRDGRAAASRVAPGAACAGSTPSSAARTRSRPCSRPPAEHEALSRALHQVYDLERLAARAATGRVSPATWPRCATRSARLPEVQAAALAAAAREPSSDDGFFAAELLLRGAPTPRASTRSRRSTPAWPRAARERPAAAIREGRVLCSGRTTAELDRLRSVPEDASVALLRVPAPRGRGDRDPGASRSATTRSSATTSRSPRPTAKVPARYVRKQTLKHAERFLTPELKELEEEILTARGSLRAARVRLLADLREEVAAAPSVLASWPARGWPSSTSWRRWRSWRTSAATCARASS